jgi:hypothetical protein
VILLGILAGKRGANRYGNDPHGAADGAIVGT